MYHFSGGYSANCGTCSDCGKCPSGSYGGLENLTVGGESYGGRVSSYEVSSSGGGSFGGSGSSYVLVGGGSYGGSVGQSYGLGGGSGFINYSQVDGMIGGFDYGKNKVVDDFLRTKVQENYQFIPNDFLRADRRRQRFVGVADEVQGFVEEAFEAMMGVEFPVDVNVRVCSSSEFRKMTSNPGVVGLSVNRKEAGLVSDIFVLEGELDQVLLTIGHEVGHVLSEPLLDRHDEEAKAFAFSFAWMEAIKLRNIADFGHNIILDRPARNGLHDVAFRFVWKLIDNGKEALEVFGDLVRGRVSVGV